MGMSIPASANSLSCPSIRTLLLFARTVIRPGTVEIHRATLGTGPVFQRACNRASSASWPPGVE